MRTREQQMAADVYEQVRELAAGEEEGFQKTYGAAAHRLPFLVRSAGLVQALAFLHSRGKEPHQKLLTHLAQVVLEADTEQLLERSREADLPLYMFLTAQVMLALKWYKRFAQSVLKVDPTEEEA